MKLIRKILFFFLAPVVFVVVLLAAVDNSDEVALKFMGHATPAWAVSWWVLTAFLLGLLSGILLSLLSRMKMGRELRRTSKMKADLARDLDHARARTSGQAPSEEAAEN